MSPARAAVAAALSIAAFLAANSYAACLLSLPGSPAANLAEALRLLPSFLAGHGPLSLEAAALATGLVAASGVWCAWAWSLTHGLAQRQGEEHGSARWGSAREGRRFMNLEDPDQNILLTERFGMAMSRPDHDRRYERNRNVLVVGGSGSGKTRGFFEPNIMQMNSDYLVTDPKGETLPRVGHMLEGAGYRILSFNTVDFSKSLHYNPLAYVRDEADILEFVSCLISNTSGDREHAGDPFWENAERLLYVALIGYLVYRCPPEDRSLSGVVTLLSLAKAKESDEGYRSPLDLLFEEVETGLRYAAEGPGGDPGFDPSRRGSYEPSGGVRRVRVADPVPVDSDFALLHYKMFKDAAGKTLKSILVSCNTRMEPFAIPQVRELVSRDEMELDRLGSPGSRRAVFAVMSDTSPLYSFLFAIMLWQAANLMCRRASVEHGGSLPVPVTMLMDEFANIGRLPDIERMVAVVRSRNVSMAFGLQSLSQLKAAYKDNAATIVDCCDTLLFLGGKSTETAKEIAESVGKETVSTVTWNESRGASASSTRNWSTLERDLVQPAEVARLPRDEAIVLIAGANPLKDRKYDIEKHPRWDEVYPGHPGASHAEPFDFSEYMERRKRQC
ncbi:conjugal transfer protein TraG [Gordonibacter urolithinfaciens]|uniref:VirD4-like conjugal transfer protein, CD1115 family n=1 Tax=Gordonibacter urolithinfaciens TaxID=1335613 RepID=UPI000B37D12A|nr:type IV secretory system conjugative DNA transfer family protein [Gordonibacter urolithinfaciens]OUO87624.1 conjugal transfer protein TraG [Gordonibacter urolithinfaciens]